jgi:hypothetical protein
VVVNWWQPNNVLLKEIQNGAVGCRSDKLQPRMRGGINKCTEIAGWAAEWHKNTGTLMIQPGLYDCFIVLSNLPIVNAETEHGLKIFIAHLSLGAIWKGVEIL